MFGLEQVNLVIKKGLRGFGHVKEHKDRVFTDLRKSWNLKVTFSRPGKSRNQA